MSADIKTVLTAPKIRGLAVCDGGGYQDDKTSDWEFSDKGLQQFAYAIERAVLEAAPASSASAMQAVDAELLRKYGKHLSDCLGGLSGLKRPCTCGFDAALQAQQSPVQASDAGRQG